MTGLIVPRSVSFALGQVPQRWPAPTGRIGAGASELSLLDMVCLPS